MTIFDGFEDLNYFNKSNVLILIILFIFFYYLTTSIYQSIVLSISLLFIHYKYLEHEKERLQSEEVIHNFEDNNNLDDIELEPYQNEIVKNTFPKSKYINDYNNKSFENFLFLNQEFYYYNPNIDDFRDNSEKKKVTYPRITPVAQWFFHSSGVDLTFESNKNEGYGGGILIRKIIDDNGKITEGSLRCYWELFGKYADAFSAKIDNPHIIQVETADNRIVTSNRHNIPDRNNRQWHFTSL